MIGLAVGVILCISAVGALAGRFKGSTPDEGSGGQARSTARVTPSATELQVARLLTTILAVARKMPVPKDQVLAAVSLALALGLPLTAAAIQHGSALPTTERWPGTTVSVKDYITRLLTGVTPKVQSPVF